jgi:hypothetical protein
MARLYAASALETAATGAKALLGPLISLADGEHTANRSIRIPYRYVGDVAQIAPDLANLDGAAVDVADFAIGDLLNGTQKAAAATASPLAQLRGGSSRVVRLTSPHLNLSITSQTIEKDSTLLLQTLSKRAQVNKGGKKASDLVLINAVGQFVAEIFVSTAAVYRSTATLQVDEESSAAQQSWLWTQGLCDLSRGRRARILQQLQLDDSVKSLWSAIQEKDYDEIAVHPVEAGMMKAATKVVPKPQAAAKPKA